MIRLSILLAGIVFTAQTSDWSQSAISGVTFEPAKDSLKINPDTKLVEDATHYLVQAQCATVCHNSQLILNNRFTRDGWKQKIRWMQTTQNLWDLGETESPILDYLEKYYAPTATASRRKPLEKIEWYKLK